CDTHPRRCPTPLCGTAPRQAQKRISALIRHTSEAASDAGLGLFGQEELPFPGAAEQAELLLRNAGDTRVLVEARALDARLREAGGAGEALELVVFVEA